MTKNGLSNWLFGKAQYGPKSIILLRLMAGGVFLWEGILKFVYPNLGVGRFTKLGIPFPGVMAPFVAILEIVGGSLLISGFLTRLIAIPFIIEMTVAILSTKIPMILGTYPLPLAPSPPQSGIGLVLHEIRSDYAQIMTVIFLLINGPGRTSIDAAIFRKANENLISADTGNVTAVPKKEMVSRNQNP
jgi:uncharacterized membrane protein YphA (DoxX/SURF4 family)